MTGIYAIRNTLNGKRYIGSSSRLEHRFIQHRSRLRKGLHPNKHLQRAWNKDGEGAFVYEILEQVDALAILIVREQFHLDRYRPHVYNVGIVAEASMRGVPNPASAHRRRCVGEANRRRLGRPLSDKHLAQLRRLGEARRGMRMSDESRARCSAANKGKKRTPEMIARMRARLVGRKRILSDAQRYALGGGLRGKKRPLHAVAITAAKNIGQKRSDATKARLRAAWVTRKASSRCPQAKLTQRDADEMRDLTACGFKRRELAELFEVNYCTVRSVLIGQSWGAVNA